MKTILTAALLVIVTSSFAAEVRHDKMAMLSKVFADPSVQTKILADGYDFNSIKFIEADDGDTEPVYYLGTLNPEATQEFKCYSIYFDTDEPNTPANVRELDADEIRYCR